MLTKVSEEMSQYSYKNKEPTPLPFRIRLDDGSTRTSLDELSLEELNSIGFNGPITKPEFEEETQRLDWNGTSYDIVDLTEQEIQDNLEREEKKQIEEKLKNINYGVFLKLLTNTEVYKKLRNFSTQSSEANTICTELLSLLSSTNPDRETIQIYINILFLVFDFSEEDIEEFQGIMNTSNLNLLYTIPDSEYLLSNSYDFQLNMIIGQSPFESWTLINGIWKPPVEYPKDGKDYNWNEDSMIWIEV